MNLIGKLISAVKKYDDEYNFTCDICGREVFAGERVCAACNGSLPWNRGNVCLICGRRVGEAGICLECKQSPIKADRARSVFVYEGEAMKLVLRFKRGSRYLYRTLASLMLPALSKEFPDADLVTFVPMSEKSQKKRGYNQSQLLAEELAKKSGKDFAAVAVKKRETAAQKTLGRREREKNLEGCFAVTDRAAVKGKRVLIIDDTLTTGSTVSELAAVLKRAGASGVCALTATSVENKNPFGKATDQIK